jgi:signal transduction histidine kinase
VSVGLAACGWAAALALFGVVLVLRSRLELAARAEHELRGPVTVISLAAESLRREAATARHARALELELDRLRAGLADLREARRGRLAPSRVAAVDAAETLRGAVAGWRPALRRSGRELSARWDGEAGPVRTDRGRLAQALGNLLANADEHGAGEVRLEGRRDRSRLVLVVRNGAGSGAAARGGRGDRGRGLAIAASAAEAVGGELSVQEEGDATVARLELPADGPPAAA